MGGTGLTAALAACAGRSADVVEPEPRKGRLGSRPGNARLASPAPGSYPLGIGSGRDGLLYVPRACTLGHPAPLVLMLHGAGGRAARASRILEDLAEEAGFLILAPDSRDRTWDAVTGRFGPDVSFIDRALAQTFSRCAVDRRRLAVAGFSDGATYALALARANGDLFTHGIAFSPGFLVSVMPRERPQLFVSHGTHDGVLPIDQSSRALVAELRAEGYRILYQEFDGGHVIPPDMAGAAVRWYLDASNFPPSRVLSRCHST